MDEKVKEQILAIRDTGLTNMFDVNTVQRLAYERDFYELVLYLEDHRSEYVKFIMSGEAYVDALKNTSSDDSLRRIQEIQTLLAQNTEKRETLTKLMTQGIIDPILFNKETNELLSQADSFRDEINALKNAVSGDVTKVTAATALLHFTEKGGILQEFDDDLFNEYVNRIIVRSRNEVRFELKCGLTLRERM